MLKTGLVGSQLKNRQDYIHPEFQITGWFCPTHGRAGGSSSQSGDPGLPVVSREALINENDVVIFSYADREMMDLLTEALKRSKHVLILDADRLDAESIQRLIKLRDEANTVLRIRQPERGNPLLQTARPLISHPSLASLSRSFTCKAESSQVSCFYGNLLRTVEALLFLYPFNIKKINALRQASGTSPTGFLSASVLFENGSVANILLSDISSENDFSIDIYQSGSLIRIGLCSKDLSVFERLGNQWQTSKKSGNLAGTRKNAGIVEPDTSNGTVSELTGFAKAISAGSPSGDQLFEHLRLREICREIIEKSGI